MAMTDEEIASAAARRSAAMRKRETKACAECGAEFEGLSRARYCSDLCRVRAGRVRAIALTGDREERAVMADATIARLNRIRAAIARGRVFPDSTDLVRQDRARGAADADRGDGL